MAGSSSGLEGSWNRGSGVGGRQQGKGQQQAFLRARFQVLSKVMRFGYPQGSILTPKGENCWEACVEHRTR